MSLRAGREQRTVQRLYTFAVAMLLTMPLAMTAYADPLVPAAWVQRAAAQQTDADQQAVDHFSGVEVIAMGELEDMRGGLEIAGLDIDVGAVVRTIIDGNLALESHISLATANEIAAALGVAGAGAAIQSSPSGSTANPATMPNVVINDARGLTRVIHDVTRNRVVSAVVNQADMRAIRQEIDINITVANFREFHRAAANARVSRALGRAGR